MRQRGSASCRVSLALLGRRARVGERLLEHVGQRLPRELERVCEGVRREERIRRLGELLADHRRLRVIALRAYGVRVDLATREAASPPQPRRTVEVAP